MATKKIKDKSFEEDEAFEGSLPEEETAEEEIDEIPPEKLAELDQELQAEDLEAPVIIEELVGDSAADDLPVSVVERAADLDDADDSTADGLEEGVSPLPKNTVIICPSCQEEVVVVTDKQICPLCGNPLGNPEDLQKDAGTESESLVDEYFLTTDEDIDYAEKNNPLTDPDVDIFDNLPFHEDKF